MSLSISIIRHYSSITPKTPNFSLNKFLLFSTCSSTAAEKFLTHLLKDDSNVEKYLNAVKAKLDSRCITQVLERCAIDKPQLGVRFFIWAALHPTHRHTSYMYNKACKLLDVEKNPQVITNLIDAYMAEGYVVSVKMFKTILNLCRAAKDANLGLWVLRKMKEFNLRPDTVSYNVVIRLLVEKSQLDEAMGLLNEMGLIDLYPDMITYISIIKGLCDVGRLENAFEIIKDMKRGGCTPNAVIYSTILDGICRHGDLDMAMEFLNGMEKENEASQPNVITYTSVINGFVKKGQAKEALTVFNRMNDFGITPNRVAFVAIFDGLAKEGHIDEACKLIDMFSGNGFENELYNLLVLSLSRGGKYKESEKMFRMMMARGIRPKGLASSCVIKRLVLERRVLDGFFLFDVLENSGNLVGIDSDVYSVLLDGLCQESCFAEAGKVVDVMVERRIQVKAPLAENLIKHLKISGEHDLASHISRIPS